MPITRDEEERNERFIVPLDNLPPSALQALYHSVTGRTENYSNSLRRNVIIDAADIDQLHDLVDQQISVYNIQAGPTVNVIMTHGDDKKVRYSSWSRWKTLPVNVRSITSDITIRWEFVFQLPNTNTSQRCVINVTMDSGLPLIEHHDDDDELLGTPFIRFFPFARKYRTVVISIDFVDYLVAKTFSGFIGKWFDGLTAVKTPRWTVFITKHFQFFCLFYRTVK